MKRITAIIITAAMLTACGAQQEEAQPEDSSDLSSEITESASEEIPTEKTEETTEAASETSAESEASSESETSLESETESAAETEYTPVFTSDKAEEYYNIIMSDMSWRKDNTIGATILDVHFDGTPEFIAVDTDDEGTYVPSYYKFTDSGLEFMYSTDLFRGQMTAYINGDEKKWWSMTGEYEYNDSDGHTLGSYKSLNKYGFAEFGENGPEMTKVMFESSEEYDSKTDIYQGEMFTNGEHVASDYIENYTHLEDAPDLEYYGWFTKKAEWEGEHLSDDENYTLTPNINEMNEWLSWNMDTDITEDICRLANAYCDNDKTYLTQSGYFGEVNAFKPVIYLYPDEKTDIFVRLNLNGRLTCTYPEYENGWNVTAMPDGRIFDRHDGKEYSYLYWEGSLDAKWDMSEGFVVKGEDCADFLREKLSYMGLTPQEYNEFIVYWLPQLQKNRYNFITFQTGAYTDAAQLDITPKPDSLLRVFMVYMPLDEPVEAEEPTLQPFERSGFTVVEWGGSEYTE